MGVWLVGSDTLARSRFTVSPLVETVGRLLMFAGRHTAPPGEQEWLATHRPAYRRRLAADPFAALFVKVAFRRAWLPDFMTAPPRPDDRSVDDELARVRSTRSRDYLDDMAVTLDGPVPDGLRHPDGAARVADLLEWVWDRAVRPDWPWRVRAFEADVVARTAQLTSGGWAAALGGMRRGMRWVGGGRLQINTYDYPRTTSPARNWCSCRSPVRAGGSRGTGTPSGTRWCTRARACWPGRGRARWRTPRPGPGPARCRGRRPETGPAPCRRRWGGCSDRCGRRADDARTRRCRDHAERLPTTRRRARAR